MMKPIWWWLGAGVLAVAAAGAAVLALRSKPADAPKPPMEGCVVSSRGLLPDTPSPFPAVTDLEWARGPATATVILLVYQDFQCPACAEMALDLAELARQAPDDLRLVFRHFPIEALHDKAHWAARAAEAAGAQGRFWEMHDLLFARQAEWTRLAPADFKAWLIGQAGTLELEPERFRRDLEDRALAARIAKAYQDGIGLGINGTPTLAFNGHYYEGPKDLWTLRSYIELIHLERRRFTACPPMDLQPGMRYTATLHTTRGDIVLELFPQQAPLAVNSFVYLARQKWYDGVPFFRVYPGFVAQTGDPSGTGSGGPGYTFHDEVSSRTRYDAPGLVGMANAGSDTNGSQFFITYAPQPTLDGKYTLFGKIIAGMEVAARLTKRDPAHDSQNMPEPDRIISVTLDIR
jgi:cyclophilin family peptidyl-prolyl cis-trans isomerase/predicted DsbA family dithiol-disulfide isomerase